jgi:hypothetical protein
MRMRWAEHAAQMKRWEIYAQFCSENLNESYHIKGSVADGNIIVRWILKTGRYGLDSREGEFLDLLRNCYVHKDVPTARSRSRQVNFSKPV